MPRSTPRQNRHRSRTDYKTPDDFIAATKARLGIREFAWDLAADSSNAKALRYIDKNLDALSPRWRWELTLQAPKWGWLNPPFDNIRPWSKKCRATRDGGGQVAFLVPAAVGSDWFRFNVDGHALVLALNGRLCFDETKTKDGYPKDCILALYSPLIEPGFEVWPWKGGTDDDSKA